MKTLREISRDVIMEGWNRQNFEKLAFYMADEIIFNYRGRQLATGMEQMKRAVAGWKSAFPDFRFEIVHLLQDGDFIALNLALTGTHLGVWKGIEPTGNSVRVGNVMIFRFERDQLVEVWEVVDEFALREQLSG